MTFNVLTFLIRKLVVKYEVKKNCKIKIVIKHKLYTAYKLQKLPFYLKNYQGSQIKN